MLDYDSRRSILMSQDGLLIPEKLVAHQRLEFVSYITRQQLESNSFIRIDALGLDSFTFRRSFVTHIQAIFSRTKPS